MVIKKFAKYFTLWQVQLGILLFHLILSVVGLLSYLSNFSNAEKYLLIYTSEKQQVTAKSATISIENYINSTRNQLRSLVFNFAKIDENTSVDLNVTRNEFVSFISANKGLVSEIAFYDDQGNLKILENAIHNKEGEGQNFNKTEFFLWSKDPKNANRIFISSPFTGKIGSSKNKVLMIIATPVYFGSRFKGTVSIRFLLQDFSNAYIYPLSTNLFDSALIVNSDGQIIAGNTYFVNKNLISYAKSKNWKQSKAFIKTFQNILKKDKADVTWVFQYPKDVPRTYLVSSSKIDIPNTDRDLYLIVSSARSEALKPVSNLRYYGSLGIWVSLAITFIGGALYIGIREFSLRKAKNK